MDVAEDEIYHFTQIQIKVKVQLVIINEMIRDYPKLHLDTNQSKGTACRKKGCGCNWT